MSLPHGTDWENPTARRRFIDRAWHTFVGDGVAIDGVSPEIARSWQRVRDTYGVDPALRRCTRLLSRGELEHRREHDEVFRLAEPILRDFAARLGLTQHVLAYFDAAGWMLSIEGDPHVVSRVAEINFCPGANWKEESAGTNGPGTALSEKRPFEVFAAEHYVAAWHAWSCAGAPVIAPGSVMPVGLVDITGPWEAHQPQAIIAARAIACAVEERLRSAHNVRDQVIEYAFRGEPDGGDALVGVDARGRILTLNDAARRRLGVEGGELPAAVREVLAGALQGRAPRGEAAEIALEWPGGAGKPRVVVSPVRYEGRAVGAVLRAIAPAAGARPASRAAARPRAVNAARYGFDRILGASDALREAVELARVAARNDLPVILCGESGTGKELFAHAIHGAGRRVESPFIAVNCGCIPAALAEAELFGYEAGTFTGGRREGNAGKFEEADGGTLFLDEVSELSSQAQTALLRVLQEREVVRLGGSGPRRVDVRIVAASNKSLPDEIRAGRFRQDLYFRLNVLSVAVPPLRERAGDVALLARVLLAEAEGQVGRTGLRLADDAVCALESYAWPGNVRELKNVLLRVAANARGPLIGVADLPPEVRGDAPPPAPALLPERARPADPPRSAAAAYEDAELRELVQALDACSWNVVRAAQALGVSRMTLYRRMQKHGIERATATSMPGG